MLQCKELQRSYQPRTHSDIEKTNSIYAHIYMLYVFFLYMHLVEKVMTYFGHELKIFEVGIPLEDMILVGKAVIPPVVFLWPPTEVVASSYSFWGPVRAKLLPLLCIADFNSLLHQVWCVLCDDTQ